MVVGCWGVLCVLNVYKAPKCSGGWWAQQAAMVCFCVACTAYAAYFLTNGGRTIGYKNGWWAALVGESASGVKSEKASLLEKQHGGALGMGGSVPPDGNGSGSAT